MPAIDEEILRLNQKYKKDNNLLYMPAVIGDGSGNWKDPVIDGKILIREQTSNGLSAARSVWPPAGTTVKLQAGVNVLLEYNELGELRIKGPNTQAALAAAQNPIQSVVQPTRDTVPQTSLETLRVIPTSPASLIVAVKAWNPIIGGTQYQFGGATVDLTSFVPAAGNMRYVVIFIKSDYATTEVFGSTARSTADVPLDSADIQECLTAATAGSTPVWAIKLTGGQTTITQEDINAGVDERQLVNTANSGLALPLSMANGGTGSNLSTSDGFLRAISNATIPYKWKLNGTAAPGVTDDANAGYLVGSLWFDTTNGKIYGCTANTAGAALWKELTNTAGGGGDARPLVYNWMGL